MILLVVLPFIYADLNIKSHCINITRIRIDMKIYTLQITFTLLFSGRFYPKRVTNKKIN